MYNKTIVILGFIFTAAFIGATLGVAHKYGYLFDFSNPKATALWIAIGLYALLFFIVFTPTKSKKP